MPQAVKLPDALIEDARAAASRESRSIAGQIEHWARLGRAVESSLAVRDLERLKGDADGAALARSLGEAFAPERRRTHAADLKQRVTYGTDPAFPGYLVRFEPSGARTPGRLVDREFVPLAGEPGRAHVAR